MLSIDIIYNGENDEFTGLFINSRDYLNVEIGDINSVFVDFVDGYCLSVFDVYVFSDKLDSLNDSLPESADLERSDVQDHDDYVRCEITVAEPTSISYTDLPSEA